MHLAFVLATLAHILLTAAVCLQLSKYKKQEGTTIITGRTLKSVSVRLVLDCLDICSKYSSSSYCNAIIRYNKQRLECDLLTQDDNGPELWSTSPGLAIYAMSFPCKRGWIPFKFSCYFLVEKHRTCLAARQTCAEMGAYLVSINNKEEDDFVFEQMGVFSTTKAFIGAFNVLDGGLTWDSGEPLNHVHPGYHVDPSLSQGRPTCVVGSRMNSWTLHYGGPKGYVCEMDNT